MAKAPAITSPTRVHIGRIPGPVSIIAAAVFAPLQDLEDFSLLASHDGRPASPRGARRLAPSSRDADRTAPGVRRDRSARHDLVDVLVGHRHLVETGGEQRDVALTQERCVSSHLNSLLRLVRLMRRPAPCAADSATRRPLAPDDEARRPHRAGNDAQHASPAGVAPLRWTITRPPCRRPAVPLPPREVVMVLDVEQHLDAERSGDMRWISAWLAAAYSHQFHRRPVFLPRLGREIEPRQCAAPRKLRVELARQTAVVMRRPARRCRGCPSD